MIDIFNLLYGCYILVNLDQKLHVSFSQNIASIIGQKHERLHSEIWRKSFLQPLWIVIKFRIGWNPKFQLFRFFIQIQNSNTCQGHKGQAYGYDNQGEFGHQFSKPLEETFQVAKNCILYFLATDRTLAILLCPHDIDRQSTELCKPFLGPLLVWVSVAKETLKARY